MLQLQSVLRDFYPVGSLLVSSIDFAPLRARSHQRPCLHGPLLPPLDPSSLAQFHNFVSLEATTTQHTYGTIVS
jgi:hypothetical protein